MLSEELPLLIVNQVHDVIVVTDNEHDVLLKNTEGLSAVVKLGQIDIQVDEAVLCYLGPVVHLNQHLSEVQIKVALKQTWVAALGEEQVLVQECWLRVKQFFSGLNQDESLEAILNVIVVKVDVLDRCRPLSEDAV